MRDRSSWTVPSGSESDLGMQYSGFSDSLDYYRLLGLNRDATDDEIHRAYKKLATRWHPFNNPTNRLEAEYHFRQSAEAYQILSNNELRFLYNKYGREGLNENYGSCHVDFDGILDQPRKFPFMDPMDVWIEFSGGSDPLIRRPASVELSRSSPLTSNEHRFENSFTGFPRPRPEAEKLRMPLPEHPASSVTFFAGSMFSGPTDDGDFRSNCTTTKIMNGKRILTTRDVINGIETITVKEDGRLTSKTVDGFPQPIY